MTTPLVRPLTREILVSGTAYRIQLTADRLTLTPKGRRKGAIEITWDALIAARDSDTAVPAPPCPSAGPPRAVLSEIAKELRVAAASLASADETLIQAGALPVELRAEMSTDPVYGRPDRRDDWFIEPLLTEREVASVLRISTRAVRHLALRSIALAGETRYRQSEIREFLRSHEVSTRRY